MKHMRLIWESNYNCLYLVDLSDSKNKVQVLQLNFKGSWYPSEFMTSGLFMDGRTTASEIVLDEWVN